jgi:tetratricopeptide (TPR) repeat protein
MAEAATLKERGNAAFAAGRYDEALISYTLAIEKQPNPIEKAKNYSNRSACLCNLGRYEKAAEDGGMAIQLHPTWPKGHYRMAEGQANAASTVKI